MKALRNLYIQVTNNRAVDQVMMAELTPLRGKFDHHLVQRWPKDLSWSIIKQSNFCKDQENFKALTYHMHELSELVLPTLKFLIFRGFSRDFPGRPSCFPISPM